MKNKTLDLQKNSSDLLEMLSKPEPFQVTSIPINNLHIVDVDEGFESVQQFRQIVQILETAQEGDEMVIKLSTDGGTLQSILPLLAVMRCTQARTMVHAVSDVSSAGTLVLLEADEVFVNPYVTVMFHQVQFGSGGPGSSVEAHVNHTMKSSKAMLHDFYQDFFTELEIESMLSGKDYYMGKEEFDERYARRIEIRLKRALEKQEKIKQEEDEWTYIPLDEAVPVKIKKSGKKIKQEPTE